MGLHRGCIGSIGTLWVMYGIHSDPMGLYRGLMGSIGALWVMYGALKWLYGIQRDSRGLYGVHRDPRGL